MSKKLINLTGISKSYGDHVVLDDLNLYIRENEFITLLGPSGCGKTTTLRIIGGFETPDAGSVVFDGKDITSLPPNERNLNTVFQKYALFPHLNVFENVAFGLRQHTKKSEAEIREIVHNKLHLVGLDNVEAMMPNNLSGGMKKRVSLARAIALEPQVILYDEPTAGLDPLRSMDINHLIVNTQRQLHTTSVVVTHDMESAFYVADRLAYLEEGEFRLIADKETFRSTTDAQVQRFIHGSTDWQEGGNTT